jgi:hypothetical protein
VTMRNGDPVPSISEDAATDEIAVLYADIRQTLGVPLVNLIWRNLATVPGALAWAWQSVKPLYESRWIQSEAVDLIASQRLPDAPAWPLAVLRAVGVDQLAERSVRDVLDSYDRSNPLNLIALNVLLAILRNDPVSVAARPTVDRQRTRIDISLPTLVNLDEIAGDVAALVRAVNRLGAGERDHILVSMPRHLAHWPGFLALYWTAIAPLDANGDLHRCIDSVLADARARGAMLAARADRSLLLPQASLASVESTLEDFCSNAISRMIPVVSLLRKCMPSP